MLLLLLLLPLHALADSFALPPMDDAASLDKGKRIALMDSAAARNYEWKTSDSKVATVDYKGRVTGRRAGTCTVTSESSESLESFSPVRARTRRPLVLAALAARTTLRELPEVERQTRVSSACPKAQVSWAKIKAGSVSLHTAVKAAVWAGREMAGSPP